MENKKTKKIIAREILFILSSLTLIAIFYGALSLIHYNQSQSYQDARNELYQAKEEIKNHPMALMKNNMIDYVYKYNSGDYRTWEELNAVFPNLGHIEPNVLQQYIATYKKSYNEDEETNWNEINRKFTEIFPEDQLEEVDSLKGNIEKLTIKKSNKSLSVYTEAQINSMNSIFIMVLLGLAFGVRYLFIVVRWSFRTIKEQEN